jgi:hypothetical protein
MPALSREADAFTAVNAHVPTHDIAADILDMHRHEL